MPNRPCRRPRLVYPTRPRIRTRTTQVRAWSVGKHVGCVLLKSVAAARSTQGGSGRRFGPRVLRAARHAQQSDRNGQVLALPRQSAQTGNGQAALVSMSSAQRHHHDAASHRSRIERALAREEGFSRDRVNDQTRRLANVQPGAFGRSMPLATMPSPAAANKRRDAVGPAPCRGDAGLPRLGGLVPAIGCQTTFVPIQCVSIQTVCDTARVEPSDSSEPVLGFVSCVRSSVQSAPTNFGRTQTGNPLEIRS
jgi:hypothetical protein